MGSLHGNPEKWGDSYATPPSFGDRLFDKGFRGVAAGFTVLTILLLAWILFEIGGKAIPALRQYGLGLLTGADWNASQKVFGILPEIWGTLYSSMIALFIGGTFGVAIAIFLTQDFLPYRVEIVLKNIIEMLAAIPSVVYGLWGIYVLIPTVRPLANFLHLYLGWFPLFSTKLNGPGLFPASLVLSIMILPTVAAVSQDAFRAIPHKIKEAVYGMGATRWEAILRVMLPTASGGIFGALVLGFGRALGETMALAMLIGNSNQISLSLFAPANTLATLLALNFPEAGKMEVQVLMFAAIVLLLLTLVVNILGQLIVNLSRPGGRAR